MVLDLGSLKSPLRAGLEALSNAGVAVTSIHPMFGPNTELLSGRHVIFIDLGNALALERARSLFAPTMAEQVVMGLDEARSPDRTYVLGLSHALNIACSLPYWRKAEEASHPDWQTYRALPSMRNSTLRATSLKKSPELYYEIQRLNDFGAESLDALARAVEAVRSAVFSGDGGEVHRADASGS